MIDWSHTSRWRPKHGNGTPVERGGQLGYAKYGSIKGELVAGCLAQKLGLAIPKIEIGIVKNQGVHTISHVKDEHVVPVGDDPHIAPVLDPQQIRAVRDGASLIPFLVWINAVDHTSYVNYVFEKGPTLRMIAVDFADSLKFQQGQCHMHSLCLPEMKSTDGNIVQKATTEIENLGPKDIADCCMDTKLSSTLLKRQKLLRPFLQKQSLL